jgi:leucyl-tRNA synthetase
VTLLNPFAPHVTEEVWAQQGFGGMLANGNWVDFDEAKCVDDEIEIVAQINGKVRAKLMVPAEIEAADAIALAKKELADSIEGKQIVKELYVKGRLVNIVVR